jgi:hypothetical protein
MTTRISSIGSSTDYIKSFSHSTGPEISSLNRPAETDDRHSQHTTTSLSRIISSDSSTDYIKSFSHSIGSEASNPKQPDETNDKYSDDQTIISSEMKSSNTYTTESNTSIPTVNKSTKRSPTARASRTKVKTLSATEAFSQTNKPAPFAAPQEGNTSVTGYITAICLSAGVCLIAFVRLLIVEARIPQTEVAQ